MNIDLDVNYLKALLVCVPTHEVRYYLCGIAFQAKGGRLTASATDGHRISQWLIDGEFKGKDFEFIVSKQAIQAVIASKQKTVELQTDNQCIALEYGTISGHVDGVYPNVGKVLNLDTIKNKEGECFINTKYVADSIKIGNLLCPKGTLCKVNQVNSSPDTTVLFTFTGVDDFVHGIMPLRDGYDTEEITKTLSKVLL